MDKTKKKFSELKGFARTRTALSYVLPYFRPYRLHLIGVIVLAFFANIFEPSLAVSVKLFFKFIFEEKNLMMAMIAPFSLIFLFLVREGTNFLYDYNRQKLSLKVVQDLQVAVYNHFIHLSLDHFDRMDTGEMMSRTVRDVSNMQMTVPLIIDLGKQLIKFLALAGICISMQPKLSLITFITFPIVGIMVTQIGARMKKYTKKGLAQAAVINVHMKETYSGAMVVKAFAQEDEEVNRYWKKMKKMLRIQFKYARAQALQGPVSNLIAILGVAFVFGLACKWAIAGKFAQDNFMAFFTSLGLMIVPLRQLARIQGKIQTAYGAVERVIETLEKEATVKEAPDAIELSSFEKEIRYENVYFKYEDEWVLKNFNLVVKKGELVALVGPSGAGKTTVVNLLPRFYEVSKGRITIDGIDIRRLTIKSLRQQIGIVTQETFLFNDTVENNIKYGSPEKTREEVIEAAKAANAHGFIMKLPQGYDTVIGERGVRLSGGERQRIAIARALVKNPPILLLDEATSSLDTEAEREVQKALDNLMKNRTTIAIAHRLSTIRNADKIIVISDGEIVEQGTHEELIARAGLYRRLYEMQFLLDQEPQKALANPENP